MYGLELKIVCHLNIPFIPFHKKHTHCFPYFSSVMVLVSVMVRVKCRKNNFSNRILEPRNIF